MTRTETRKIGRVTYCIYCAEPSKRDSDGSMHNNDYIEYDVCNCFGAKKVVEKKVLIKDLWADIEDMPKISKYKLDKLQFDIELKDLRDKYNVPVDYAEDK